MVGRTGIHVCRSEGPYVVSVVMEFDGEERVVKIPAYLEKAVDDDAKKKR